MSLNKFALSYIAPPTKAVMFNIPVGVTSPSSAKMTSISAAEELYQTTQAPSQSDQGSLGLIGKYYFPFVLGN